MVEPASLRRRGLSVRIKLTLSYAGFLVLAGFALAAVTWYLLRFVPQGNLQIIGEDVDQAWAPNRSDLLRVFFPAAGAMLIFLSAVGLGGGWVLAGRMLKPLSLIDQAARRIADGDLTQRVQLPGRTDEFRTLSDVLDLMLDRLEQHVGEQRRFAANASHELRTPLAMTRTILEVAQADPEADIGTALTRLTEINERSISATESLLLLARLGRSSLELAIEEIDTSSMIAHVVENLGDVAERNGVTISSAIHEPIVFGNRPLIERLLSNLVHNAIVHNSGPDRRVWVATAPGTRSTILSVENTGAPVDPSVVSTLTEPFQRSARSRTADSSHVGAGLGLAICASIVRVHDGELQITPRDGGGLTVTATLPWRAA
jgi:two-component system sensor histidine kinase VanS